MTSRPESNEFNGVGRAYLRPGQWFTVGSARIGDAKITVLLNDDGSMTVAACHHKHGGTESVVTFTPEGKLKPDDDAP